MNIVFLLKPIFDMLYEYQILDIFLSIICCYFLLKRITEIRFCEIDVCVIILCLLFLFAYLRDTSGFSSFVKVLSGFMLYFLGRIYYRKWISYVPYLQIGFLIAFVASLFSLITGAGFQYWGNINTFSGFYFFKTDLAAAMAQTFILFAIIPYSKIGKYNWIILIGAIYMIILSNTRMYYFVIVFLLILCVLYYGEKKYKLRLKLNLKIVLYSAVTIFAILLLLNYLSTTSFGQHYLMFKFDKISDLNDGGNTQGRNVVWEDIMRYFLRQDSLTQFVGVDFVKDAIVGGRDAHNLYVKLLFCIGYLGFFCYLIFIVLAMRYINVVKDTRLFYLTSGFLCIFLLGGFSYSTILSTQMTWFLLFFIGVVVSRQLNRKKFRHRSIGTRRFLRP